MLRLYYNKDNTNGFTIHINKDLVRCIHTYIYICLDSFEQTCSPVSVRCIHDPNVCACDIILKEELF